MNDNNESQKTREREIEQIGALRARRDALLALLKAASLLLQMGIPSHMSGYLDTCAAIRAAIALAEKKED